MPNPKGKPENLQPMKSEREEPLTEQVNLRVSKSMKEKIQQQQDPPEFCRQAIQKALDEQQKSDES
jgi:hypothetical protein